MISSSICVHCNYFLESRVTILPAILRHLRYHIKNRDDILDKSLTVLGSILTNLHDQDQVSVSDRRVNFIHFPN